MVIKVRIIVSLGEGGKEEAQMGFLGWWLFCTFDLYSGCLIISDVNSLIHALTYVLSLGISYSI